MFKKITFPFFIAILVAFIAAAPAFASADGIEYSTHVENEGWHDYVRDGNTAGTTGLGYRLEGIKIRLVNPTPDIGVEYRAHVQDHGWQDWVGSDQLAGTEGQGKRIEAVSIRLTGAESPNYNVFYRVHAQNYGWLGWAKNGEDAGTSGIARRLEAIEIKLQPAGAEAPTSDAPTFIEGQQEQQPSGPDNSSPVHYKTYVAGSGWKDSWNTNGTECGSGDGNGIEAIQIGLNDDMRSNGGIEYRELGNAGWTGWTGEDQGAGNAGDPIQGLRIRLTGKSAFTHDIYYRLHVPNVGWTNLAKNGEACGSEGYGRPANLVQIWITGKADQPNAPYGNAFADRTWYWPLDGIHGLSTTFGDQGNGSRHDGIDIPAGEGTPIHSAKDGVVKYVGYGDGLNHSVLYGGFGNVVAVEHDSGETCYYAHMSRFNTSPGARVGKGQVIGFVGTTGNSLGNHLHFEVYDSGGNNVDPMRYY